MAVLKTESGPWLSVRSAEPLEVSLVAADHLLVAEPERWLPGAADAFQAERDSGLASVGLAGVRRRVRVTLGPVTRGPHSVCRHIAWRSASQERLFPTLEGSIMVSQVPSGGTVLEVNARYRPPLGRVGRLADRALLHLVASGSIRQFGQEVAARMTELAAGLPPDAGSVGRAGFQA